MTIEDFGRMLRFAKLRLTFAANNSVALQRRKFGGWPEDKPVTLQEEVDARDRLWTARDALRAIIV
jgi:hypothetical protein